ncbi:MAG: alpha-hydroxy-acid oxidizing protein [Cyclobacteriaceae bacterium]|nr:alpha-hydroxy-acid oxidizing protein [Cyclobacteriaceae bacterium]
MNWVYDSRYPSVDDLRERARRRIPRFAFEYLDGGCNEDVNLRKNTEDIRAVELAPNYIQKYPGADLRTDLFGHVYDAPFGVAPVGLQGLMWPSAAEILAKAAHAHNVPFVLSTVTTASIESIATLSEGRSWYQLYHPAEDKLRDDLLRRLEACEYPVLVLLCDVPTFGFRPRDIRNGLSMPPKMTLANVWQILGRPRWALETLRAGTPQFATMKPYMPKGMSMKTLGLFMSQTFSGRLDEDKIKAIRDRWKGKLVLKGVAGEADAALAHRLGFDGIWVSNHGGRQIDVGESAIHSLKPLAEKYKGKMTVMMDSGIRSGADVARSLAAGADFAFLGRTFMYSVAALGQRGGDHAMALLKAQLKQVLEQVGCGRPSELGRHLVA